MAKAKVETVAKRHINRLRMEDKAYRHVYGRAVFHPCRVALIALLQECAHGRYELHPETKVPLVDQKRVQDKVSGSTHPPHSEGTVRRVLGKAIELGLMTKARRGLGIKGNKAYLYFTDEEWNRVKYLNDLFAKIDLVIDEQSDNPGDKWAGRDLLPPEVYYNIEADDGF